jgi:galactofuranose transport system ATP-binding protein
LSLLVAKGLTKSFPGVKALQAVDFELRAGEIHTLMGENGAGKSTLIKILTGVYQTDAGEITLADSRIAPQTPIDAQRLGISTVYQEVNLVPSLSVGENLFLGRLPIKLGKIDWRQVHRRSKEILAKLDLSIDPRITLSQCSIAVQQLVAIGRALDVQAKVLILDEPTSSLDAGEVDRLFDILRRLREQGLGIVFVSHFLDQVYAISDRFTVLRNGQLVGTYEAKDLPRLSLVARMLGRGEEEVVQSDHARPAPIGEAPTALAAEGLTSSHIGPINLAIRQGEVVGLAGLLGSGRTEIGRLLFGLDRPRSGALTVANHAARFRSPLAAIRAGLGFVPEDRKHDGIIPNLSIRENIALALQAKHGFLRPISLAEQRQLAEQYIKALRIAAPNMEARVGSLSGGNQQKVVLARWLASQPKVLILDEPTRGVDVGAKAEIDALAAELCRDGLAILLIASEIEDVARQSHRVLVLRDRKVVGELAGDAAEPAQIMKLIAGESR